MMEFKGEATHHVIGDPNDGDTGRAFSVLRSGAVLPRIRCISDASEGSRAMRIVNIPRQQADLIIRGRSMQERRSRRIEEQFS